MRLALVLMDNPCISHSYMTYLMDMGEEVERGGGGGGKGRRKRGKGEERGGGGEGGEDEGERRGGGYNPTSK